MKARSYTFAALLLALAAAGSMAVAPLAQAQSRDAFERLESLRPEALLRGVIREEDVSLLIRHLREQMIASARGEETEPSEAMKRRSEQIQREIAARGSIIAGVLLSAFEHAVRDAAHAVLRDPPRCAPPQWPQWPPND